MGGDASDMANILPPIYKATPLHVLGTYCPIDCWNTFVNLFIRSLSTTGDSKEIKEDFKLIKMAGNEKLHNCLHHTAWNGTKSLTSRTKK